jgi:hypothetical protein
MSADAAGTGACATSSRAKKGAIFSIAAAAVTTLRNFRKPFEFHGLRSNRRFTQSFFYPLAGNNQDGGDGDLGQI